MRSRVVALLTRDLDDDVLNGRTRTLSLIQGALASAFEVRQIRLRSALESGGIGSLAGALAFFVLRLLVLRPVPLQCALFNAPGKSRKIARAILAENPDAVYLDSIRCIGVLAALRRMAPRLRIVMDMDDLMSSRFRMLRRSRMPYTFGYLTRATPAFLRTIMEWRPAHDIVLAFEEWAMRRVEKTSCELADAIVLVSAMEAARLKTEAGRATRATIADLSPPVSAVGDWRPRELPIRFCFVGSDRQLHNREAIDHLMDIWRRLAPEATLHIAGAQQRPPVPIPNIVWEGEIADLADLYDSHSVLLFPTLLSGGVKTKVIEAFAYGAPVIAFAAAFEGLHLDHYPLRVDEPALEAIVRDPAAWREKLDEAARVGHALVVASHSPVHYREKWIALISPTDARKIP